jgi:hypothetical protein
MDGQGRFTHYYSDISLDIEYWLISLQGPSPKEYHADISDAQDIGFWDIGTIPSVISIREPHFPSLRPVPAAGTIDTVWVLVMHGCILR